jgi:type IV pilus assembly protein PilE
MFNTEKTNGITLLELLITVAIIGILTVLATKTYSPYVRKSRRIDAINVINSIALEEERYRSNNTQYGTLAQVWGGTTASPEGYYTLSISNVGTTTYTITATAVGDQANDAANGTSCATMQLTVANGAITKTPAACWPS